MLPLTRLLKRDVPGCNQPWYADDAGAAGSFSDIERFFNMLSKKGPARGYFPEPTKSILVVKPESVEQETARFAPLGFQISIGARYLYGYIGHRSHEREYVAAKVTE